MLMRKINAVVSLLTVILLLDHVIFNAVWMISRGTIEKNITIMPWILFALMLVHAVISIYLLISGNREPEKRKYKSYPKLNGSTIVQRISGIVLIVLTGLHVAGAAGFMTPPPIIHATVPAVFFTITMTHLAVSTSKAFVTLGIGTAKFVKAADLVMKVLCVSTLIASLTGFYLYKV